MYLFYDETQFQSHRDNLQLKLSSHRQSGETDLYVLYPDAAMAFPGGPHPNYKEFPSLDWKTLQVWAKALGWKVEPISETPPNLEHIPHVRFLRE